MTRTCLAIVFLMLGFVTSPRALRAENWPRFRGPTGLGYTAERNLLLQWGGAAQENVAWKTPLVGQGHASPIVWNDRVFVCTVRWPAGVADRSKVIPEHHVLCYDARAGRLLWDTQVPPGPWLRSDFRSGPGGGYAAPTPTTDGRLVFCAFGSSVLAALDFEGRIVWRKEIVPFTFDVTLGSSPVLYGQTVILFCAMAQRKDSCVLAWDQSSGAEKWRQPLPTVGFGHSTPLVIDVQGQPQLLILASGGGVAADALQSLNPENGQRLWWCRGGGDASSPAYGSGRIYFDSGRGGLGVCVDPTGRGDVSGTHIRWTVPEVPEGIGSPTIVGDAVYRLHSPGVLKCWELASGRLRYAARLNGLSTTWASPIVDPTGRIFFANGGRSLVLQAGPELKILAENDLGDTNHASAAVADGSLFLAGQNSLYCVRKL